MLDVDKLLNIQYVHSNIPGITEAIARYLHEAFQVCLEYHRHTPGTLLLLDGNLAPSQSLSLIWKQSIPENAPQAHADLQDSTEDGAVALAILLITDYTEYTVVSRAPKGEGFDYFLLPKNQLASFQNSLNFLSSTHHLEVSGILKETKNNSRIQRLQEKRQRFQKYGTNGINLVIIVAFDTPVATMESLK